MKRALTTIAFVTLFLAASTSAQNIKVHVDYDKSADFSIIETFAWTDGTIIANQLVHQRLVKRSNGDYFGGKLAKIFAVPLLILFSFFLGLLTTVAVASARQMSCLDFAFTISMMTVPT